MKPVITFAFRNWKSQNTPKAWQTIGNIGLILATVGAAIATLPVNAPATLVTIGIYCTAGGTVLKAVTKMFGLENPITGEPVNPDTKKV